MMRTVPFPRDLKSVNVLSCLRTTTPAPLCPRTDPDPSPDPDPDPAPDPHPDPAPAAAARLMGG